MNSSERVTSHQLISKAKSLGFETAGLCSICDEEQWPYLLANALEAGHHATMEWMIKHAERRSHPKKLWPEAQSAFIVGQSYAPAANPLAKLQNKGQANISVYAQGYDYHDVMKKKLKNLARWWSAQSEVDVKLFVDTAPLMEKPLAQKAGLGWQGKHTNLVGRPGGSWLFLGIILTDQDFEDVGILPHEDRCGSCRQCLDICPTDAFPSPYQLDAGRCISYLTIEHKGSIPLAFRKAMGNRVYGCDDCLAVCPWNKFALIAKETKLTVPRIGRDESLLSLLQLDDEKFRYIFSKSPIKRIGWARFLRNILIASGNSGDLKLRPLVSNYTSNDDEVLRETALWALNQLSNKEHD